MITSCTSPGATPERFRASRMAMPPSSGALNEERAPRNFPIGVRAAPTMTGVRDLSDIAGLSAESRADKQVNGSLGGESVTVTLNCDCGLRTLAASGLTAIYDRGLSED